MVDSKKPPTHADAPIFYADQPAGMAFSPQVTRLTFGIEDDDESSDFPRPVVSVVMPTDAVISMVRDIMEVLENDKFKEDMIKKTAQMAQSFADGLQREVSKTMVPGVVRKPESPASKKKLAKPSK
ncbi:hypothetical protein [Stenotrophomonas sp.]|uniref:hypothetical protein n=1 Tax=Stenotrophomonas sp. TaxID=69392 RepID=UPI001994994B|nr:hypothetical protein [Stenotrophomonas sp.]MBD3825627.1 hypothetical protein [Stenotrophomonas sp.]